MSDKYSDIIRKNAKDVGEAFKEFSTENEWHHGSVEYFINEPTFFYNDICKIGDIVFVREYTYSDGSRGKNHLFVIVESDYQAVPIEYFGMLISSQLDKLKFDTNILLSKDKDNRLDKDSIVKLDQIYRIKKEQIVFKLGRVDIKKVEHYKKTYYEIISK